MYFVESLISWMSSEGLPLRSSCGEFRRWLYSFVSAESFLVSRANCPSRRLCRNRPSLGNSACDDGRELAPAFLQLRFQIDDTHLARTNLGAIRDEIASIHGCCAIALAAKLAGSREQINLDSARTVTGRRMSNAGRWEP